MSDPKGVTMQKELTKYYDSVTNETIVCLRSPLRLGRPDALNSTMILELCWWYDPLKEKLKERFTFSKGILLSRAELDAKYPSSTEEPLMPTEEELAERRHETGDFSSASVIISAVDRKTRTHCHICTSVCLFDPLDPSLTSTSIFPPEVVLRTSLGHDTYSDLADSIVDVPLNDRWEDTLAILVHPRAPRTPSWWAAYLDWTVAHGWEKARKLLVEKQGDAEYWAPTLGKVVQVGGVWPRRYTASSALTFLKCVRRSWGGKSDQLG